MPRVVQSGEFFVVGGPVQPDRACYVPRSADERIAQFLREHRFCYVLGPRGSGKTSLMARTIQRLRGEKQLAAVIDLSQIGARGEGAEAGRWYYSIAYRIVRELRLKVDLQAWWQEKSVLVGEQRLADFFWEIVLAHTSAPVTVFFDDIERGIELPFSRELFVAMSACYDARATEPEYKRLNFVVLGVATPRELGLGITLPLFEEGAAVEVSDFSLEESYRLSAGFRVAEEQAHGALNRIYYWVKGQPYLTQKIARAVARRNGTAETVDDVVQSQFLAANARDEEPLLSQMTAALKSRGALSRRALVMLGQLGKGAPVVATPHSAAQALLLLAGVAIVSDAEFLTYRNRLVKALYTSRWVRSALPFNWRAAATAAAIAAVAALAPIWYTQYFPRPYIDTLTSIVDDYTLAHETHDKLRRFPGFGATADRLLAEIMMRRSDGTDDYAELLAADTALRDLAGYEATADALLGEFWLRRAQLAIRNAHRDEALIYADLARIGTDPVARVLVNGLIDSDYPALVRTYRFETSLAQWEVEWSTRGLTTIDAAQRVRHFGAVDTGVLNYEQPITALRHRPVSRELAVDVPGSADDFQLQIDLEHGAAEQLTLLLESPSGAAARFSLPPSERGRYELRATGRSPIALLADADRQGVWRLTLIDREQGVEGRLNRWALQFAEEVRGWADVPDQGLAIPDPQRTDQVVVQLSADGHLAVAQPVRADAAGALTLWDMSTGAMIGDIPLAGVPEHIALSPDATRLITVVDDVLTIWDVAALAPVGQVATTTGFALTPIVGVDGQYIAIAEQIDTTTRLYSLLRAADGELVASIEGAADVDSWVLGPQGRYLALLGAARVIRLIDPRRGELLAELPFETRPIAVVGAADDALLTVDDAGDVVHWSFSDTESEAPRDRFVGVTIDAASVSVSDDGNLVAYAAANGHVVVKDLSNDVVRSLVRVASSDRGTRTRLAPDGTQLVTADASMLRLWAIAPPDALVQSDGRMSAMALDDTAQVVAVGFRDGHLQIRTAAQIDERVETIEDIAYVGHRGAITALALNVPRGVIASGGRDGVVRIWQLTTGAPTTPYLRHPDGPINAVAISRDGQRIVSAAADGARVWNTASGDLEQAVPANQAALAVAIAPNGTSVASGDAAGNIFGTVLGEPGAAVAARAQAAVTALVYSPDGATLVSGDRSGRIQLWDAATVRPLGTALVLPQPIRWLGFSGDGGYLTAQTDHWVHRVAVELAALRLEVSRLVGIDRATGAPTVAGADTVRLVGGLERGFAEVEDVSWRIPEAPGGAELDVSLERDWMPVLQLDLDDRADIVPRSF